jgi:acyl carrier protein
MGEPSSLTTRDVVRAYIVPELLGGRQISNDENLLLSGLIDSLAVMSLVAFLERRFSLKIPFDDVIIENFMSLDAIDAYVASRRR